MIFLQMKASPEAFLVTGTGAKTPANFGGYTNLYPNLYSRSSESIYAIVKDQLYVFGGNQVEGTGRQVSL